METITTPRNPNLTDDPDLRDKPAERVMRKVMKTIARRDFCTLATVSPAGRPHVAGVVYSAVGSSLWIHTLTTSRKARNAVANPHVAVSIPFRRLPAGPPFTIHFQARAELVAMDDAKVIDLVERGDLKAIAGHGALDMADGVFVEIVPTGTIHSYGPGARTIDLIRDPLNHGAASFRLQDTTEDVR
ncbi:MAG: pyridoxamine 5'-phosphate oxidase family protein [Actinomycetota bacterium]